MGCTVWPLGSAPTVATEGPAVEEGPAAAMSEAGDPTEAKEGPVAEGDGPWHTRGL